MASSRSWSTYLPGPDVRPARGSGSKSRSRFADSTAATPVPTRGRRARALEGRCEGRKPYGFHPNERAVVEHMKDLRRKPVKEARLSFDGIAQQLNAEGHTTRYGKPWTRAAVHVVLSRASS
jgi:hypothetical protein